MVRIGVLLTNPDWERQKCELLQFKKSNLNEFPWNKYIPDEAIQERRLFLGRFVKTPYGVSTDRAVGSFIMHAYKNEDVEVDFIDWEDISMARLRSNDLNFIMIYDILEAFHMDPTKKKTHFQKVKYCLTKAKNIFPPRDYQEFINSKIAYYKYFKENRVSILPTATMTAAEYKKLGHRNAVQHLVDEVRSQGWDKFIAKPEYGQESRDLKFFTAPPGKRFDSHVQYGLKKYPGLIFQKANTGFGQKKDNAEVKMFYCGDSYNYTVIHWGNQTRSPEATCDKSKLQKMPLKLLRGASRKVLKKMPEIVMPNGVRLPRLVTRVDMGYKQDGKVQPFVNEVEFCPSYYVEEAPVKSSTKFIKNVARQMVKITRLYVKRRASLSKPRPGRWLKRKTSG